MKKLLTLFCLFSMKISYACEDELIYFCFDFSFNLSRVIQEFRNSEAYYPDISFDLIVNQDDQKMTINPLYGEIISCASTFYGSLIPEKVVIKEIFQIMSENQMRFLRYEQLENQYKVISTTEALSIIAMDLNDFNEHAPSA